MNLLFIRRATSLLAQMEPVPRVGYKEIESSNSPWLHGLLSSAHSWVLPLRECIQEPPTILRFPWLQHNTEEIVG